jgi:hypothetical protein
MKYVLYFLTTILVSFVHAQNLKVQWQDESGRAFNIIAPTGELGYTLLPGDKIQYNINGNPNKVGDVYISYNFNGQVNRVGNVYMTYGLTGRLMRVGNMYISYNFNGQITGTTGSVN